MTIDEAIKLLVRWQDGGDITSFDDVNRAVRLGIEALKIVKITHPGLHTVTRKKLPGETEI